MKHVAGKKLKGESRQSKTNMEKVLISWTQNNEIENK